MGNFMDNIYQELSRIKKTDDKYNALRKECEDIVWGKVGYVIGFFVVYAVVTFVLMMAMMILTSTFFHEETQAYINSFEEQKQGILVIFGGLFATGFFVNLFVYSFLCYINEKRKVEVLKEVQTVIESYELPAFTNIYSFFDAFKEVVFAQKESFFNERNSNFLLMNLKNKDPDLKGFENFIFENTQHLIKENEDEETLLKEIEKRMSSSALNSQSLKIIEE